MVPGCTAPQQSPVLAPASGSTNRYGAPVLTQPELDVSPFVDDRCALLTRTQLRQLGITVAGRPGDGPLGKDCSWRAFDTPARIALSLTVNTELGGLDNLYARKHWFRVWKPLEISGYPAVIADDPVQHLGDCQITLAISRTIMIPANMTLNPGVDKPSDFTDPCSRGVKILEQVIITLQGRR
ncbi:DUF3558 domain-containing protein [Crossiella sp. S99.2]|nr:DUF3558 domain-containing protein [Crossiella sp. S99.2]MCK2258902.1 DUF3558 domain-containing protein [Crossiella sp. S99.1]